MSVIDSRSHLSQIKRRTPCHPCLLVMQSFQIKPYSERLGLCIGAYIDHVKEYLHFQKKEEQQTQEDTPFDSQKTISHYHNQTTR